MRHSPPSFELTKAFRTLRLLDSSDFRPRTPSELELLKNMVFRKLELLEK